MLCYTFHSIAKKFVPYNVKEMKKILRKIDYEDILKIEMEEDEADSAIKSVAAVMDEISILISREFELSDEPIEDEFLEKWVTHPSKGPDGIENEHLKPFK